MGSRPAYRAAPLIAPTSQYLDMAGSQADKARVLVDEDEYVKCFLELPKDFDPSCCLKPILNANPFKELENAENRGMLEAQIFATMVSERWFLYPQVTAYLSLLTLVVSNRLPPSTAEGLFPD